MQSLTYIDYEDVRGIDGTVRQMLQTIDQLDVVPVFGERVKYHPISYAFTETQI